MVQNMKLSIITEAGENFIVTVNKNETFAVFTEKLMREHNLIIPLDSFKTFSPDLALNDNFFDCLKLNLTDEDLINLNDTPAYIIDLSQKPEEDINISQDNHTLDAIVNENLEYEENTSLIVLSSENQDISHILQNLENLDGISNATIVNNEDFTITNEENDLNYKYINIESKLREIHDFPPDNVTDYCRLCAKNITNSNKILMSQNNGLKEQINLSFPIKILDNDGLPQQLCEICSLKVQEYRKFLKDILEADKILKLKFGNPVKNDISKQTINRSPLNNSKDRVNVNSESAEDVEYLEVEQIETSETDDIYRCRICDLIVDNLQEALSHSVRDHNMNNLFACIFCEYGFDTVQKLSIHIQTEHKDFNNKYKCKVCFKNFMTQKHLQKHVCAKTHFVKQIQHLQKQFNCSHCDKIFNSKQTLLMHIKTYHDDSETIDETLPPQFSCLLCDLSFPNSARLNNHLSEHGPANTIMKDVHCCKLCKEAFQNQQMAIIHNQTTHGLQKYILTIKLDRVYRCEFCNKCFILVENLIEHRLGHIETQPYVCNICHLNFSSFTRCASHKITHSKIMETENEKFPVSKYYVCKFCSKSYLTWDQLIIHKTLKHSNDESVFTCTDCKLDFPTVGGFSYHRKTKHNEDLMSCAECGVIFVDYQLLIQHRLSQHPMKKYNLQCVKCSKVFANEETLREHLKVHQTIKENKCPYCTKSFITVEELADHVKIHRTKRPSTNNSPKSSKIAKSNARLNVGDDFRPFICDKCGLTFRKKFALRNHVHNKCTRQNNSNFVLMVNEDENLIADQNPPDSVQIVSNTSPKLPDQSVETNYIDIGNGNYVALQDTGTLNIDGVEYVFVKNTDKDDTNNIQMMADLNQPVVYDVSQMQINNENNSINNEPNNTNSIIYVNSSDTNIMDPTSDYIFSDETAGTPI